MSARSDGAPTLLTTDVFLQKPELIEKAAAHRGLTLKKRENKQGFQKERFKTGAIGTYKLDKGLLEALKKVGFTFEPGIEPPHNTRIYLSGNSNQRGAEIFESDCWSWKLPENDHQLSVYLKLSVNEMERGVVAVPEAWGNNSGGPCHRPTINKLVVAIANYFPDAHPLLKEMTADSYPVIHWSEIGLGGVRSVAVLFKELYEHNESVSRLAGSDISPFIPDPEQGYKYFVPEPDQPRLFEQWRNQLQEYKNRLY